MIRRKWLTLFVLIGVMFSASCNPRQINPTPEANMPNPASVHCEQNGGTVELRQDASGGVIGVCVFPDGSECDEWAYFRGECKPGDSQVTPAEQSSRPSDPVGARDAVLAYLAENYEGQAPAAGLAWTETHPKPEGLVGGESYEYTAGDWVIAVSYPVVAPENVVYTIVVGNQATGFRWEGQVDAQGQVTETSFGGQSSRPLDIPTPMPIDPADYQGWWTYTHPAYGFSFLLPPDWVVDETTTGDPLMNGHMLSLHPQQNTGENLLIRVTFRHIGEDALLWPTGVGNGEFVPQGTLDVAGQPARRILFVCPTGQVNSIWYHGETDANIQRGNTEFGFIFSYTGSYCQDDYSLGGKAQRVGEMIIASLAVP